VELSDGFKVKKSQFLNFILEIVHLTLLNFKN